MEKDRARAAQIADEIGSIVIAHDGCEGKYLGEAGCNRADVVAAVTGDDEDNLVICQMAKHHFDVPRTIARVNNPKNEALFRHLGVDELISPTRMILGSIEQDIPVHELLHLAALGEGELELIEAHLQAGSPAIGRAPKDLSIPEGCSLFAVIRDGVATPLRPDTVMLEGDKVIAIGKQECQELLHDQLIGEPRPVGSRRRTDRRPGAADAPRQSSDSISMELVNTLDNVIVRVLGCVMFRGPGRDAIPDDRQSGGVRHDDSCAAPRRLASSSRSARRWIGSSKTASCVRARGASTPSEGFGLPARRDQRRRRARRRGGAPRRQARRTSRSPSRTAR